jgi:hypothetical protein
METDLVNDHDGGIFSENMCKTRGWTGVRELVDYWKIELDTGIIFSKLAMWAGFRKILEGQGALPEMV